MQLFELNSNKTFYVIYDIKVKLSSTVDYQL